MYDFDLYFYCLGELLKCSPGGYTFLALIGANVYQNSKKMYEWGFTSIESIKCSSYSCWLKGKDQEILENKLR